MGNSESSGDPPPRSEPVRRDLGSSGHRQSQISSSTSQIRTVQPRAVNDNYRATRLDAARLQSRISQTFQAEMKNETKRLKEQINLARRSLEGTVKITEKPVSVAYSATSAPSRNVSRSAVPVIDQKSHSLRQQESKTTVTSPGNFVSRPSGSVNHSGLKSSGNVDGLSPKNPVSSTHSSTSTISKITPHSSAPAINRKAYSLQQCDSKTSAHPSIIIPVSLKSSSSNVDVLRHQKTVPGSHSTISVSSRTTPLSSTPVISAKTELLQQQVSSTSAVPSRNSSVIDPANSTSSRNIDRHLNQQHSSNTTSLFASKNAAGSTSIGLTKPGQNAVKQVRGSKVTIACTSSKDSQKTYQTPCKPILKIIPVEDKCDRPSKAVKIKNETDIHPNINQQKLASAVNNASKNPGVDSKHSTEKKNDSSSNTEDLFLCKSFENELTTNQCNLYDSTSSSNVMFSYVGKKHSSSSNMNERSHLASSNHSDPPVFHEQNPSTVGIDMSDENRQHRRGYSSPSSPLSPVPPFPRKGCLGTSSRGYGHSSSALESFVQTSSDRSRDIAVISAKCDRAHNQNLISPTNSANEFSKQKKTRNRRRTKHPPQPRMQRDKWWKNKKPAVAEQCLLQFSHGLKKLSSSEDESEDDTLSTVSHSSSVNTWNSESDEEESVGSFDSQPESINSFSSKNEVKYASNAQLHNINANHFVAVFWLLEDCPIPPEKSVKSIVQKIRDKYCLGYTEVNFTIACDLSLDSRVGDELSECGVSVILSSTKQTVEADRKLCNFVFRFSSSYNFDTGSIVLLTVSTRAVHILSRMPNKKNIHKTLIFNGTLADIPQMSFGSVANEWVPYSQFLKEVPNDSACYISQHYLLISNLPSQVKWPILKRLLKFQIKHIQNDMQKLTSTSVEILFHDEKTCIDAYHMLKSFRLYNCVIGVQRNRRVVPKQIDNKEKAPNLTKKTVDDKNSSLGKMDVATSYDKLNKENNTNLKRCDVLKSLENCSSKSANNNQCEPQKSVTATLYVSVNFRFGDVVYWEKEFKKMFQHDKFHLQWSSSLYGGIFLLTFNSLNKIKKAKKLLMEAQKRNSTAPKFLKLVKDSDDADLTHNYVSNQDRILYNSSIDRAMEKREMYMQNIQQVDAQCSRYLEEHEKRIEEVRRESRQVSSYKSGFTADVMTARADKLNELNEMKSTFLSFTDNVRKKIKEISGPDEKREADNILTDYSRECCCLQNALPVYAKKNTVINAMRRHRVVVIQAETGSGKSTQICQYIWREGFANDGMIVCTQPRKIAAVSLANHVSSQVGCRVGNIVGYQVGLSQKKSPETKILYVTDFTLLKLCTENPLFNGIACIVIDEAHERSIYTDLLLGMIKRCLRSRSDLKVVITSATIKVSLFQEYFSLPSSAVMNISGRSFPIEDVWLDKDVDVASNYFDKTIDTASRLVGEDPGDILAFLPTPAETEKAVQVFNHTVRHDSRLLVFCLHGKMDVKDQQKIFERTPTRCRKIVFSTNCAETSVTIPGIKYVIDCGMVKEARYDAVRNLSILAVGFVNKSSAEQRRGRAGRVESGKCYRLYSRTNYANDMADQMVPEILRVNLGQAILKLMVAGIRDPLQFEFVESPPRRSMEVAMEQLVHLGAVTSDCSTVTAMGQKMAVLPLEPRLGHLLLKGIDLELGYETVIIASLATLSRSIFFRNSDNKSVADLKKVRFCLSESDYLTYLEVYKEWLSVPKNDKTRWCSVNCINAKSMRLANELVTEILQTLTKELKITVSAKTSDDVEITEKLHKIIFRSFSQNLCVYGGHDRIGYISPSISESLHIHPSSSLYSLGKWRPQFLVYDSILKTSQTFLINITMVTDLMCEEAMIDGKLTTDPFYLLKIVPRPFTFHNLSENVLRSIIGVRFSNVKTLENQLQDITESPYCVIDADYEKGQLSIFTPPEYHEIVKHMFKPMVLEARKKLKEFEHEFTDFAGVQSLSAVLGAELIVKQIIFPGEYRSVKITPRDYNIDVIHTLLKPFGEVVSVKEYKKHRKFTFRSVSSALASVKSLKSEKNVIVVPDAPAWFTKHSPSSFRLEIHISRRPCNGLVFFNVKPETLFPLVSYRLATINVNYYSSCGKPSQLMKVSISRKDPQDLRVTNVPPYANDKDLRDSLCQYLPPDAQINKFVIVRQKAFSSSKEDIDMKRKAIYSSLTQFTPENKLDIDFKPPKDYDIEWRAMAIFHNFQDGQKAYDFLKKSPYIDGLSINKLKPKVETSLFCNKEVFAAIKPLIDEALKFFNTTTVNKEDWLNINAINEDHRVRISLDSNGIHNILDANRCFQTYIEGEKIDCNRSEVLGKLFLPTGKQFLKNLKSKVSNGHLAFNGCTKVISLFGPESARTNMKTQINKYLDSIANVCSEEISLISGPKSLLKEMVRRYGENLNKLKTLCKLSSASINVYRKVLTVSGNSADIDQCKELISHMFEELGGKDVQHIFTEDCPVCFEPVMQPAYRLAYCGHAYCSTCFLLQLQNVEDVPVVCCKEGCGEPVCLKDLEWAIGKNKSSQKQIHSKALDSYVKRNNHEVKFCPSPDCTMLYRVSCDSIDSKYSCPTCGNSICRRCCVLYHFGMDCDYYQMYKNVNDRVLADWMKQDPENRKSCPSCRSPIEKNGGCLHVTCWKCQCHMCWRCMRQFGTENEVYNHQSSCPAVKRR